MGSCVASQLTPSLEKTKTLQALKKDQFLTFSGFRPPSQATDMRDASVQVKYFKRLPVVMDRRAYGGPLIEPTHFQTKMTVTTINNPPSQNSVMQRTLVNISQDEVRKQGCSLPRNSPLSQPFIDDASKYVHSIAKAVPPSLKDLLGDLRDGPQNRTRFSRFGSGRVVKIPSPKRSTLILREAHSVSEAPEERSHSIQPSKKLNTQAWQHRHPRVFTDVLSKARVQAFLQDVGAETRGTHLRQLSLPARDSSSRSESNNSSFSRAKKHIQVRVFSSPQGKMQTFTWKFNIKESGQLSRTTATEGASNKLVPVSTGKPSSNRHRRVHSPPATKANKPSDSVFRFPIVVRQKRDRKEMSHACRPLVNGGAEDISPELTTQRRSQMVLARVCEDIHGKSGNEKDFFPDTDYSKCKRIQASNTLSPESQARAILFVNDEHVCTKY